MAAACLLLSTPGLAQQPGGFHLREFGSEFGLEAEWRDERRSPINGVEYDLTELMTREFAGIRLRGDVYHPALLDFAATLRAGLTQRALDNEAASRSVHEGNLQYDIQAHALKEKATNLSAYARRGLIERRQTFFETARGDSEEWGAILRLGNLWVPSELNYGWSSYEGRGADNRFDQREVIRLSGGRFDQLYRLDYGLEHHDITQRVPDRAYRESRARVAWQQHFVPEGRDRLDLTGSLLQQEGDLDYDFGDARADLHLEWSDSLSSDHGASVREVQNGAGIAGRSTETEYYSTVRHRLYRSLDSMLGARRFEFTTDSSRIDRDQLEASFDYRKTTNFGAVGLRYAPRWYEQDERSAGALVPVLAESHVVVAGVPVVLDRSRVVATSIVVSDQSRTTVYSATIDYVVREDGDRTELRFPVGSSIVFGQTILVDYDFAPGVDRRFRSARSDAAVYLEFGQWGLLRFFYNVDRRELLEGTDDGSLGDFRSRGVRAEVRGDSYELGADYEDRDDSLTSYERAEFRALKSVHLSNRHRLAGEASTYRTRFRDHDDTEHGSRLAATYEWTPDQTLQFHARGEYHTVDYIVDEGWGMLLEAGLEYHLRAIEFRFDLRYTRERFEVAADRDLLFAYVSMQRTF